MHLYMYWVRFTCTSCVDITAADVCFRFYKISAKLLDKLSCVCYGDIEERLISACSPTLFDVGPQFAMMAVAGFCTQGVNVMCLQY